MYFAFVCDIPECDAACVLLVYALPLCFHDEDIALIVPQHCQPAGFAQALAVSVVRELNILPSTVSLARWDRSAACVA